MGERATRVGVKIDPPTLIVIYSLDLDQKQTRIRKIPIKQCAGKRVDEIVDTLLSRQNHATLLRSINKEKLIGLVSKLPDVIHTEPSIEKVEEKSTVESESEKIESEKPKPKFTMPLLSDSENSISEDNIDDLLGMTKKPVDNNIDDLLGFSKPPVENVESKQNALFSSDDENEALPKKEKTNFSFLDSDEDDFKPLPTTVEESEKSRSSTPSKSSVASWLKSTDSEKEEAKTTEKDNYDDDFTEKTSSISESSLEEQIIDDNPYLANLQASAKAARRGSTDSLSDTESTISQSELNDLSDAALAKVKAKMDVNFSAAQLKPGDPGFVYDKQNEFKPTETCEWDDSIIE